MNRQDAHTIIALAALAANADGALSTEERVSIADAAARLGVPSDDARWQGALTGTGDVAQLAHALSSEEARIAAYDVAAAVCHVDGSLNARESAFLSALSRELGASGPSAETSAAIGAAARASAGSAAAVSDADAFILDQAMLT
ncbi:MAG: DUF533 domain-containing protein, partial [Gemmatimonadaceae bacterium]